MCTWKHVHLWTLTARNNNMVALFSELSKTFKRKRFQGENALGETKVFSSSQTLTFLFTIWPSYSGFDFIIKIDICTGLFRCVVKRYSKYCSIRSRIRKKKSSSERDKQQTFSIISQYHTSCYKQLSGINCESCKFDFVA